MRENWKNDKVSEIGMEMSRSSKNVFDITRMHASTDRIGKTIQTTSDEKFYVSGANTLHFGCPCTDTNMVKDPKVICYVIWKIRQFAEKQMKTATEQADIADALVPADI